MIIVGAKGFAKQLIEVLEVNEISRSFYFFDDISNDLPEKLYEYPILKTIGQALEIIKRGEVSFCLGLGNPTYRKKMAVFFEAFGGVLTSVISKNAFVAKRVREIGPGYTILTSAIIENDVVLGKGALINSKAAIYHDSLVGHITEVAPGAKILGGVQIGSECFIGANSTILPGVKIGNGSTIGDGAVVTKDISSNTTVAGVPAKRIRKI